MLGLPRPIAIGVSLAAVALATASGCEAPAPEPEPAPKPTAASLLSAGPHDQAVVQIRGMGAIRFDLLRELAPKTVDNFVRLAEAGFYDGTAFHRVVPGFMIQGGDPNSKGPDPRRNGEGGPGYEIGDEFSQLPHARGIVSMANKGSANSAGSQFFIVHQDQPSLDGKYTAFGRITQGIEMVDAITQLNIDIYGRYGPTNRPYPEQAVIESIEIEAAGGDGVEVVGR